MRESWRRFADRVDEWPEVARMAVAVVAVVAALALVGLAAGAVR